MELVKDWEPRPSLSNLFPKAPQVSDIFWYVTSFNLELLHTTIQIGKYFVVTCMLQKIEFWVDDNNFTEKKNSYSYIFS